MKKRTVIYARVSGDDTRNDGRNLEGQLEMGREFAQDKGYAIVAELSEDDRGASGANIDLPQLNRIRALAQDNEFDVLVVREIDRLSRNLAKQLIIEEEMKKAGVTIEYVLADYEDSPEGRLNKHIRATIAEYEREKIRERMIRGKRNKAKQGKVARFNFAPYGYDCVDGQLIINDEEAQVVRKIFDMYVRQRIPITRIRKNLEGIPTASDKGKNAPNKNHKFGVWQRSVIRAILSNQTYTGVWKYGKTSKDYQAIPISVPAIITTEMFEKAQKLMPRANTKKYTYLLTGLSSCICGRRIVGKANIRKNGRIDFYYYCSYRNRGDDCTMRYYRVDKLDEPIWQWISNEIANPIKLDGRLREYQEQQQEALEPIHNELSTIRDLMTKQNKQRTKWLELFAGELISKSELEEKLSLIARTLESLAKQKDELESRLTNAMTEDSLQSILRMSADIRDEIQYIDSVEARRKILEALEVVVRLEEDEHGNVKVKARACIGTNSYMLSKRETCDLKDNRTCLDATKPVPRDVGA